MDVYKILIRQGVVSQNRPQLWRFHLTTGGNEWETSDLTELETEVRSLLQSNPIPIISIVKSVDFDISVEIN